MSGPNLTIRTDFAPEIYSDSRTHLPQGPNARKNLTATRNVRLPRATASGGQMSKNLRIIRLYDPEDDAPHTEYKSNVGSGGYRIDASRNMWEGSGLKTDSSLTDVAWCHGLFNNKILTTARNGELIMWDLNKSGSTKYELKTKDHQRSVHKLSVSQIVHHYCITGSADGDLRIWDIREMQKSLMRIRHPTSVRAVCFSPSPSQPLQAVVGLDNGSIYRNGSSFLLWELRSGQRGQLDRLPVAHTANVTSLDWCLPDSSEQTPGEATGGLGWIVSAGLDRCVKLWDLSQPNSSATNPNASAGHIPHKPTYTLHPSFPVRRVLWRPGYECEVAVVSNANAEFGSGNLSEFVAAPSYASAAGNTGVISHANDGSSRPAKESKDRTGGIGDAVEIWDVRRGWIAKWTVRGSSNEGGATDIAFRDSHAIWASHSSGMFSQIDLREATKPIDAIPRVAATWEASGTLTFVADPNIRWEMPYDDIRPGSHPTIGENKKFKSLGDAPYFPDAQTIGCFTSEHVPKDIETFTKLARAYRFEGSDRTTLCEMNAQVAFQAGQDQVAEIWLLLASGLSVLVPESPAPSDPGALLPTAPAMIASNYTFPPSKDDSGTSPGRHSFKAIPLESRSSSTSRKLTPTSSNSSSPQLHIGGLPPVTPRPSSRSAYMGRRQSADSGVSNSGATRSRRPSHYRRMSMSAGIPHSSNVSPSNTRHIGEGALDDSDSSSSGSIDGSAAGGDEGTHDGAPTSDDESAVISPSLITARMATATSHPSPLSKVAGLQRWPEDEEGEDEETSSPSPMSTDTEDDEDGVRINRFKSPRQRTKSKSTSSARQSASRASRLKSRSRSSTLASLAAPHTLVRQSSHSSILTVTAGDISFQDVTHETGVNAEETLRDLADVNRRQRSQAVSDFLIDQQAGMDASQTPPEEETKHTERRIEFISYEEDNARELTWEMLREALEIFADEGDIQTCTMLALIAPRELRIGSKRVLRLLEAYIDNLTRLQLHSCAAYLRKYCQTDDVRNTTQLETTIHTSCSRCRKPLVLPAGTRSGGKLVKGGFSFCISCKMSCVTCAICRLPVHKLLFQCSVCHHGGHQDCYRRFYLENPMLPIPGVSALSEPEHRGRSRGPTPVDEETATGTTQRLGHPSMTLVPAVRITMMGTSTMMEIIPFRQRGASLAGKNTIGHQALNALLITSIK
ncbi:hypothetical protein FB45DRAFT_978405 [Roridomyces roridus]|uniref:WD40 repeat-like protein n=1 Tax=Roridomyces roridus TaxID=1738132 RepID=A0AAD7FMS9_9AGAR|nr:hypothetical protein FB45DRAFT_978405 [Roridomyces roridus]